MTLYISVINHNHDSMIIDNNILGELSKNHKVILKSNTPSTQALKEYCVNSDVELIEGRECKGFGANNNEVFYYATNQMNMNIDDFFLVLNPDVCISNEALDNLIQFAKQYKSDISTINLYKDKNYTIYDNSIRKYPSFLNPIKSLLNINRNDYYDKSLIKQPTSIDWAAGSFLLFTVKCYKHLNGFNENYFMYFEDVDICTRANKNKFRILYYPDVKAIHYAAHQNRKIFSKNFIWYISSLMRYHFI
ncbi:glycosyltransferase [Vibrio rhizosphaerae]|uniref:glycosyltransferase n=1 Tax=Vibrio rhizosphaerae TaxID=398736 RepID=UPI00056DB15F|nr:glycosyltransferase [Vibrio rhizosphaerae]